MLHVIQTVRYIIILILIFLILLQNPKVDGINTFGHSTQSLSNTRNTENILHNMTWVAVSVIFLCTIFLATLDA